MKKTVDLAQEIRRLDPVVPLWLGAAVVTGVVGIAGSAALAATREYAGTWGVKYRKQVFADHLSRIHQLSKDKKEFQAFCNRIAPYRYVNDTLRILHLWKQRSGQQN